jgi:adenosylcobyric acid synthase
LERQYATPIVWSALSEINGLALLNIETALEKEKQTSRYSEKINSLMGEFSFLNETMLHGYEIHHGISIDNKGNNIKTTSHNNVFGTYIHGLFENGIFTMKLINHIRHKKEMTADYSNFDYKAHKEKEFDKLEKLMRDSLDIEAIYKIMEAK